MSRLHRQKIRAQRHEASAEKQTPAIESVSTAPAASIEAPIATKVKVARRKPATKRKAARK